MAKSNPPAPEQKPSPAPAPLSTARPDGMPPLAGPRFTDWASI